MVIIGTIWPQFSTIFKDGIAYYLVGVIYLSFIKSEDEVLKQELSNYRYLIWLVFLTQLILPVLIYTGAAGLVSLEAISVNTQLGATLLYAAPTAAIAPTAILLFNGRFERGMLHMVITSLFSPVTIPFVMWLTLGDSVKVDLIMMAKFLGLLMVIPFIASEISKRFMPGLTEKLRPNVSWVSIVLLFFVILGSSYRLPQQLHEDIYIVYESLGFFALVFMVNGFLGWFLSFKKKTASKITASIISSYTNIGLAIVLAESFFGKSRPQVVVFIVISTILWNFMFIPLKYISRKIKEQ